MKIIEYFSSDRQAHWLGRISQSDWSAGKYLARLLSEDKFHAQYGGDAKILLLTEGDELLSFCTYVRQDNIAAPELYPWIGFVYTFTPYRSKRCAGKLIEYAYTLAKKANHRHIYLSTNEVGLYEKYGFSFLRTMNDTDGEQSRIYSMDIISRDYSHILGTTVSGTVDRPLGSCHPRHPDLVYPVNYGYVDGLFAADGAEQDVYILGTETPLDKFKGTVTAVYHRINDIEDKWIVTLDGRQYSKEEILNAIEFQEKYFIGELYTHNTI